MWFVYHPKTDKTRTAEAIVLRKLLAALPIAAVLLVAPTAAFAADGDYPPPPPPPAIAPVLSLAGSSAGGICDGGAPFITYNVKLNDPANISTGHTAYLVLSDGTNSLRLLLGDLDPATNTVSGSLLWPGASVDASGNPTGWPGWEQINGQYVYTGANYGWTRSAVSATIEVNPEIAVPVSYPPATAACSGPQGKSVVTTSSRSGLSSTGVSPLLMPIGLGAVALVLVGLVVFLLLRRRTAR